ncbi:helix-turn-helix domain-containing protein [Bosea beijingensis]
MIARTVETPSLPSRTSPAGAEHYLDGRTLISSDGPAWKDVFVRIFTHIPVQSPFLVPAVAEPLLVWIISGCAVVEERDIGGEWMASRVGVGEFFLTQSATPYEMRWRTEGEDPFQVMHLYLSIPLIERAAAAVFDKASGKITLRDVSGGRDATLSHILSLLQSELIAEGSASTLFVEGLAQSLAVHLVRHYAVSDAHAPARNALPGSKLRRAIAFMGDHLQEPFDLGRLAQAAGYSEFHFSRLFKSATGLAPSRYFIRHRMTRARQLLQETDTSIIQIAMAVGYSSPSHFAQIFRRETGQSPSDYRRD